jgi:hypothetical protein
MSLSRTLLVLPVVLALVIAGCSASGGSPGGSPAAPTSAVGTGFVPTQRNEGSGVTIEVAWAGPAAGPAFDVKLDTHSVDLDGLDLADAVLSNDRGESLSATPWEAPAGGHHRAGRLVFEGDVDAFLRGARWIELKVAGVGAIAERVLRWEIPG